MHVEHGYPGHELGPFAQWSQAPACGNIGFNGVMAVAKKEEGEKVVVKACGVAVEKLSCGDRVAKYVGYAVEVRDNLGSCNAVGRVLESFLYAPSTFVLLCLSRPLGRSLKFSNWGTGRGGCAMGDLVSRGWRVALGAVFCVVVGHTALAALGGSPQVGMPCRRVKVGRKYGCGVFCSFFPGLWRCRVRKGAAFSVGFSIESIEARLEFRLVS